MATFRTEDLTTTVHGHMRVFHANRPIIFLDIDDVLCVYKKFNSRDVLAALSGDSTVNAEEVLAEVFHPVARYYLAELHEEFLPLYVISSSWVLHLTREQLCETFRRTGIGFVAESLHGKWCTVRSVGSNRRVEIEGWLTDWLQRPAVIKRPPLLIIDDLRSGGSLYGSPLASLTVLCTDGIGLTYREFQNARGILKSQLDDVEKVQHIFTLIFDISDCAETPEEIVELLSTAGLSDAIVVPEKTGQMSMEFILYAHTLADARDFAIKSILLQVPNAEIVDG